MNEELITLTTTELSNLLKIQRISNLTPYKLECKLLDLGYKLIKVEKKGKRKFYYLKEGFALEEDVRDVDHIYELKKKEDKEEFGKYKKTRIDEEVEISQRQMAKDNDISRYKITKWDEISEKIGLMKKGGDVYVCVNKHTGETCLCDEISYKEYKRENYYKFLEIQRLYLLKDIGQITEEYYEVVTDSIKAGMTGEYHYYKFPKREIIKDSYFYKLLFSKDKASILEYQPC